MSDSSRHKRAASAVLCGLQGLAPKSAAMLAVAGIESRGDLRKLGAVAAFLKVRRAGHKPSLNLLWAIEGALTGTPWVTVARNERTRLLLQMEDTAEVMSKHVDSAATPSRQPRLRRR